MGLLDDDQLRNDFLYQLMHNPRGWRGDRAPYGGPELRGRGPGESRNPYAPMERSLEHTIGTTLPHDALTAASLHPAMAGASLAGTGIGLLYGISQSGEAVAQELPDAMKARRAELLAKQKKNKDGWLPKADREELISINKADAELAVERGRVQAARQKDVDSLETASAAEARRAATPSRDLYPWLAPTAAGAGVLLGAGLAGATRGRSVGNYNTTMGRLERGWKGAVDEGAKALGTDAALAARKSTEATQFGKEVGDLAAKGPGSEWVKPMVLGAAGTDVGLVIPEFVDYQRGGAVREKAKAEMGDLSSLGPRLAIGGLFGSGVGKIASAVRAGPMATPNYTPETAGLQRATSGNLIPDIERLGATNRAGLHEQGLTASKSQDVQGLLTSADESLLAGQQRLADARLAGQQQLAGARHSGRVSDALRQYELEALRQRATKGQLDQIQKAHIGGLLNGIDGPSPGQGQLQKPATPSNPSNPPPSGANSTASSGNQQLASWLDQTIGNDVSDLYPADLRYGVAGWLEHGPLSKGRPPTKAEVDKAMTDAIAWVRTKQAPAMVGGGLLGLSAAQNEPSLGGLLAP